MFLVLQGWIVLCKLFNILLVCIPSLQLLKSQSCMSWISLLFTVYRKNPKGSIQEPCVSAFLRLGIRALISHSAMTAELCQLQKQPCERIAIGQYLWCTSHEMPKTTIREKEKQ